MKRKFFWLFVFIGLCQFSFAPVNSEAQLRTVENNAFQVGEYLKYRIHYGIIDAGIAELRVKEMVSRRGRPTYHIVGTGRSVGLAEWFFRTRDRYETFIDKESILPWEFIRDIDEGGYKKKHHFTFDHFQNEATDLEHKGKKYSIPDKAQDILSSFYFARTFDQKKLKVNDKLPITVFLDYEEFPFFLRYHGKEMIDSEWGEIRCLKFTPLIQEGRVFEDEEGMTLWVSDDENKVPVRLQAELQVGSVKMDLEKYKGLKRPLTFK